MTRTCCMTSHCALAKRCARHAGDVGKHLLSHTDADSSEELLRRPDNTASSRFSIDKHGARQARH